MKAMTYIKKIIKENKCSIYTAEKITEALKRENLLHVDLALRFRPLFGDFDIMPKSWLNGEFNQNIKPYYIEAFKNPIEIIDHAIAVTRKYTNYINNI